MIDRYIWHPTTTHLAMVLSIFAIFVITCSATFSSLWALWQTSDHRHGILVFPISAFLIWRIRYELTKIPIRVDARGLILLAVLVVAWTVARLGGVQVVEQAATLAMMPAMVLALLGARIFDKLLFPMLFLLLATPVSDSLIPFLMVVTADIATALLSVSGIPFLREGQYLTLPGGNFVVADVCSGARYLVTGVMVTLLYGYLTYSSVAKRVILVGITALLLVLANGVRAYSVMAVASATDMQYLGGRDHIYFGWLLFGLVMVLVMWAGARYADAEMIAERLDKSGTVETRATHTALPMIAALVLIMLAITVKPMQADFGETGAILGAAFALLVFILIIARQHHEPKADVHAAVSKSTTRLPGIFAGIGAVAVLVLAPRFVSGIEESAAHTIDAQAFLPEIPCAQVGNWPHRWRPRFTFPDVEYAMAFDCNGATVSVYTAAYAGALQGREMINSSHHPVPQNWDRISTSERRRVTRPDGSSESVVEVVVAAPAYNAIVWYWYDNDGAIATGPRGVKLQQILALLPGRPAGGRVVVIESAVNDDPEVTRQRLADATQSLMAEIIAPPSGDVP